MYVILLLALIVGGLALASLGLRRCSTSFVVAGLAVIGLTVGFFLLLSFWGEMLWFRELGFSRRFWTQVWAEGGIAVLGALVAAGLTWALTRAARADAPRGRWVLIGVTAAYGVGWGAATWDAALRWALGVVTGTRDPIFRKDTGFYLFALPFYDALFWLLLVPVLAALLVAAWPAVMRGVERFAEIEEKTAEPASEGARGLGAERPRAHATAEASGPSRSGQPLLVACAALALVLAYDRLLAPYHLMYSRLGVVTGAGWTDVHVRLPFYYATAAALIMSAVFLLDSGLRATLSRVVSHRFGRATEGSALAVVAAPTAVVAGIWIVGLGALPLLSQWLLVQPNELARERPYLSDNIRFTRDGFGLGDLAFEEYPVQGDLTPAVVRANEGLLSEVRLWDPRALKDVLAQIQQLRLYYEMPNVDIERYALDGHYRQVLVAAREIEPNNLPLESQTFVNRHFKYTHGYGLVMAPVSEFTPSGLPELIVRDVPPVSDYGSVRIDRPEIYYGELTNQFVVGNSRAPELDYPAAGDNVYVHYAGAGGVPLENLWRKLVLGWKVGGTRFLFSDYPMPDSRVMFRRNVVERVAAVAPFLTLDEDPYAVVVDGRIKWILDAYTTSSYYPYSEPYAAEAKRAEARGTREGAASRATREGVATEAGVPAHETLGGVNYVRNSVKAVVDAYDGTVTLYVFDPSDPIVRVWSRIYPSLFRGRDEMPASLRAHVRYPETLLHAQGMIFAKYHMTDPTVFYNQEDLWVRATEKFHEEVRPVEPYYVMWQAPGSGEVQFILMQPFTPKNRQVLIGWIAGLCDGDNYGKMVAYRFPKDKWILGPQQVETKIDQSPALSAQLTLWDQHGKRVIRGNVLAIPIAQTILYVEPIYLQAQTAAYPELRVVVLMHGDDMSYAPTFASALEGLVTGHPSVAGIGTGGRSTAEALDEASRAFDEYQRLMSEGQFVEAGKQLEVLRDALKTLEEGSAERQTP